MPTLTRLEALDMNEPLSGNVRRLMPQRRLTTFDPFARLEELFMQPPAGWPPHQHRGFEGVTYVLDGSFRYADALMNAHAAGPGSVQRFTAGRGLHHSEQAEGEGQTRALQLWVALRRADKERDPDAQQVEAGAIPETQAHGVTRRVVLGEGSPVTLAAEVRWLDLQVTGRRATHAETIPPGHQGILYVLDGAVETAGAPLPQTNALCFQGLDTVEFRARKGTRCALIHGRPHGEPIRAWGMNVD